MLNECHKIFKDNPSTIIGLQETHFKESDAKQLDILARFKTHNSTYDGNGNRQKVASIFFCNNYWTEEEFLHKSDNVDLVISSLKNKENAIIVCNVYAPTNHNAVYFNNLKDIINSRWLGGRLFRLAGFFLTLC